jgi:hypothetical protein
LTFLCSVDTIIYNLFYECKEDGIVKTRVIPESLVLNLASIILVLKRHEPIRGALLKTIHIAA